MAKTNKELNKDWIIKRLLELPEEISQAETKSAEAREKLNTLNNYHQKLVNEFNALIAVSRFYD